MKNLGKIRLNCWYRVHFAIKINQKQPITFVINFLMHNYFRINAVKNENTIALNDTHKLIEKITNMEKYYWLTSI